MFLPYEVENEIKIYIHNMVIEFFDTSVQMILGPYSHENIIYTYIIYCSTIVLVV